MLHQLSPAKGLVLSLKIQIYFIVSPCLHIYVYVSVWTCVCVWKERLPWDIATHGDSTQFSIFLSHFLKPYRCWRTFWFPWYIDHGCLWIVEMKQVTVSFWEIIPVNSVSASFPEFFVSANFSSVILDPTAFGNKDCAFPPRQRWAISEDPSALKLGFLPRNNLFHQEQPMKY